MHSGPQSEMNSPIVTMILHFARSISLNQNCLVLTNLSQFVAHPVVPSEKRLILLCGIRWLEMSLEITVVLIC